MIKKILLTTALVAVICALIIGAVNRTLAGNNREGTAQGSYGREQDENSTAGMATGANGQWQTLGLANRLRQGSIGELQSGTTGGSYDEDFGGGQGGRQGGSIDEGYGDPGELAYLPPATPGELSAEELAALLFMLEEEKLAHDVYLSLYERWGLRSFQNISQSEQTHMNAVIALIERYELDNTASSEPGVFMNPDLQSLYNALVEKGSLSVAEALKVGAAIEEIDILDLEKRLTQTDNADIQQVFNSLIDGSKNHLRAFVSTLNRQTGENYAPQYLSAEAYQAVIGTGISRGGGFGGGGSGRGGGNGRGSGGFGGGGSSL